MTQAPRSAPRIVLISLALAVAHWLCRTLLDQFRGEPLFDPEVFQDSCVMFAMFLVMLFLHRASVIRSNAVAEIEASRIDDDTSG